MISEKIEIFIIKISAKESDTLILEIEWVEWES